MVLMKHFIESSYVINIRLFNRLKDISSKKSQNDSIMML